MTAKISKKLSKELKNIESTSPDEMAAAIEKEQAEEEKRKQALGRADERIKRSKVSSGTISMYLSEISQYEPLAPEKEVELAVLIDKGDLQKTFVLRRILNPMGTTDAIEFLISKLKQTKTNSDFFDSMNT